METPLSAQEKSKIKYQVKHQAWYTNQDNHTNAMMYISIAGLGFCLNDKELVWSSVVFFISLLSSLVIYYTNKKILEKELDNIINPVLNKINALVDRMCSIFVVFGIVLILLKYWCH